MQSGFRIEHVGSFLRPKALLEARDKAAKGDLTREQLRQIEDTHIIQLLKEQDAAGIKSPTDGEFRRAYFHLDFCKDLEGVTVTRGSISPSGVLTKGDLKGGPPQLTVTGKLKHVKNIQVDDFKFLQAHAAKDSIPKVCIPSLTMMHFRGGRKGIDIQAYPDLDEFFEDLAACYRAEIAALYEAGCRYIQLDDTNLAYLCDPQMRKEAADRGEDVDTLPRQYAQLINAALRDVPSDMYVGIHLCRGNYRSQFFGSGGYAPVAEVLFKEINVNAFFLEFDDERSGDFQPLKHLPEGKRVVLGLITTKRPDLESQESIIKRIHEAAEFAPIESLALSPQCGFASTAEGNEITPADQWNKMKLVVNVAKQVWKDA